MKTFSHYDIECLKLYYPHFSTKVIAVFLGKSPSSVYRTANAMGIKKSEAYMLKMMSRISAELSTRGEKNRFKKGHIPSNKGQKVKPHVYEAMKPTMFKKGQTPINHKPVGSERVNVEGYVEVKVAEPSRWELKHRLVWVKHFGEIPKGYNVQFKDRNPTNLAPENLYIISKSQQVLQNTIHRYPEDVQKAIRLISKLNKKIRSHETN